MIRAKGKKIVFQAKQPDCLLLSCTPQDGEGSQVWVPSGVGLEKSSVGPWSLQAGFLQPGRLRSPPFSFSEVGVYACAWGMIREAHPNVCNPGG